MRPLPSLLILFSLYFSQGLPSGFLAHALPALMRDQGVALQYIGLLKLLALPWALKFLWAPYVDQFGVYRLWVVLMQLLLASILFFASFSTQAALFGPYILLFLLGVVLVNSFAATQDIATDGLAVKLLAEKWRGLGNSVQVAGFKLGMILSGSLLLVGVDQLGWSLSFRLLAILLVLLLIPSLFLKVRNTHINGQPKNMGLKTYLMFFKQVNMGAWLWVLVTYKISDSLGSAMIKPMLIDQGYGLRDIAELTFWSSIFGLLGAVLAGILYYRWGQKRLLISGCFLQAVGIAAYAFVANGAEGTQGVYVIALFEQAVDGLSTVVLFSLMMSQCRVGHEGADFTVQASIQVLISGIVGALSGVIASILGFTYLFVLAGLLGVLAMFPVMHYFRSKSAAGASGQNKSAS